MVYILARLCYGNIGVKIFLRQQSFAKFRDQTKNIDVTCHSQTQNSAICLAWISKLTIIFSTLLDKTTPQLQLSIFLRGENQKNNILFKPKFRYDLLM